VIDIWCVFSFQNSFLPFFGRLSDKRGESPISSLRHGSASKDFEKGLIPPNKKLLVVLTPEILFLLFLVKKIMALKIFPLHHQHILLRLL
jgi:hypothetical protein